MCKVEGKSRPGLLQLGEFLFALILGKPIPYLKGHPWIRSILFFARIQGVKLRTCWALSNHVHGPGRYLVRGFQEELFIEMLPFLVFHDHWGFLGSPLREVKPRT